MSANFTPDKEDIKILPPFKMQVLTNFPYIEADFDALTNYQLLCKIVEYLNAVIHNENEVTEEVTGLYNAYVSLQNYVNNYFDNLDVQEEINNKLDEMAEDGTLADIIADYIRLKGQLVYNSVAEMKAATNLYNGSFAKTYGFTTYNDGGGALYKVRTITNDDIVDEMTIIALYDDSLIAEFIGNTIDVRQYGAVENADISNILNKALNDNNKDVYINGNYKVSQTITAIKSKSIKGSGSLTFNNSTGDGLVLGDSIILDGITLIADTGFVNNLLVYDGSIGERTYPSTSQFKNLILDSITEDQINCFFMYKPYQNYGMILENIFIGQSGSPRKANYGIYVDINVWANSISLNNITIDIYGTNIIPLYVKNNDNNSQMVQWNFSNVYIQARQATYTCYAYFRGLNYSNIINCHIYDIQVGTYTNSVIYDKCAYMNVVGSENMRLIYSKIENRIADNNCYEHYSTPLQTKVLFNTTMDYYYLSTFSGKLVPLFFPRDYIVEERTEIEIQGRYTSGITEGFIFRSIIKSGGATNTAWYSRDIYIECNKYGNFPVISKIETFNEGTVIWIKGGTPVFIRAESAKKPEIITSKVLTEIGTENQVTVAPVNITESTTYLSRTTYPLYFWSQKYVDSTNENLGT